MEEINSLRKTRTSLICGVLFVSACVLATQSTGVAQTVLPDGASIAINFGATEPSGLFSDVAGAAGIRGTVQWNNVDGQSDEDVPLIADVDGASVDTTVVLTFDSNNTWASTGRGEENNTAPDGDDRNLMTGYLDTNATDPNTVTIDGLPDDASYDVVVYIKGGVIGRGGDYAIGDQVISHVDTAPFDGMFVRGAEGDFIVFVGITGPSFSLTGTPTTGAPARAPINGIEVVLGGIPGIGPAPAPPTVLPDGASVAINFGADEPDGARSDVTGAAGILETVSWNNVDAKSGDAVALMADVDGAAVETTFTVTFDSNNTWASTGRGEENNTAPDGDDRNLMTGYLDTNATDPNTVTVDGLPGDASYDVVVYLKGGVVGRGGDYTIGDQVISHVDAAAFDGAFVKGSEGDFIVFTGITGSSFTLTGTPTTGTPARAPINGIEVVIGGVPVPPTVLPEGPSIAINFGADEPDGARSDVSGPAGARGTANWNNVDTLSGDAVSLMADIDGTAMDTTVTVTFDSNNTWASTGRGEENNTAPDGDDRNLMTGYLDTNATDPNSVTIDGLVDGASYDVVVYIKGGVNGRGGDYAIGDQVISHVDTAAFDGTFVEGSKGDFIVFTGITGPSFTLTGTPATGTPARAPINGIEVILAPAPGGVEGISVEGGNVVITFTGQLKGSDGAAGPYTPIAGATSPFTVVPDQAARFFIAE